MLIVVLSVIPTIRPRVFFFKLIKVVFMDSHPVVIPDKDQALGRPDQNAAITADCDHDNEKLKRESMRRCTVWDCGLTFCAEVPLCVCRKGSQKKTAVEAMSAQKGTRVRGSKAPSLAGQRLILEVLSCGRSRQRPYNVLDATYRHVLAELRVLRMRNPFQTPAACL